MSDNMLNILGNLNAVDNKQEPASVKFNEGVQVGGNELAILNKMNEAVVLDNVTTVAGIGDPQNDTSVDESYTEEEDEIEGVVFKCNTCGVKYMAMTSKCPHCQSYDTEVYGDAVGSDYDDDEYEVEEIDIAFPDSTGHFSITNESVVAKKSKVLEMVLESLDYNDDDDDDDAEVEVEKVIEKLKRCNEGTKTVVHGGKLQKIKVKTKKKKMSSAQKKALAKARKKAHTSSANKARNKSMKVRRKKLGEGKSITINESAHPTTKSGLAVLSNESSKLVEYAVNLGFQFNRKDGNFVKRVNECTLVLDNLTGDVDGVGLYGLNSKGQYINESKLNEFVDELGLNA